MKTKHIALIAVLIIAIIAAFIFFSGILTTSGSYSDAAIASNHSEIWKTSNSVIDRESKGTVFSRGDQEKWFYLFLNPSGTGSNYIHKVPFTVEFDVLEETYRCKIEFRDKNHNVSDLEFNTVENRGVGHWKIVVNSTTQEYYLDGKLVKTDNQTFSDNIRVGFVGVYNPNATNAKNATNSTNSTDVPNATLKFSNFKFY